MTGFRLFRWLVGGVALMVGGTFCSVVNAPGDPVPAGDGAGGSGAGTGGQPGGGGTGGTGGTGGSGGTGGAECDSLADCQAVATTCRTATACMGGECQWDERPDGTSCDNDLYCTEGDTCEGGVCQPGPTETCESADPCEPATCDEDAEECTVETISTCANDDGCCPSGCDPNTDNDCLYWATGVLENVPEATLTGWTQCHVSTYAASTPLTGANGVLTVCDKAKLLLACRPVGSQTFTLVAMGNRADVLFDCGTETTCVHPANGVGWYYSGVHSWGFAPSGVAVNRSSCDHNSPGVPEQRMCWHTAGEAIDSGYRCGDNSLNGDADWVRMVYHAD